MGKVLKSDYFARPALIVARQLIGQHLVRRNPEGKINRYLITETEAYLGSHDLASHASRGLTPRNTIMFGPPGHWYVYFTYGMHWMLNVVTGKEGSPSAVLIRGAGDIVGPARLTKALGVDKALNSALAARKSGLWVEESGLRPVRGAVKRTPRIGVDYAGEWAKKPYRFVLDNDSSLEV